MPETRAIMVMVPPLLADLIRRSVTQRLEAAGGGFEIVAQLADAAALSGEIASHRANIVIMGPQAADSRLATDMPEGVAVLRLSADLTTFHGQDETEPVPFTPEALAERLRILSQPA